MDNNVTLTLIELYSREKQCKGYRKVIDKEVYSHLTCDKRHLTGGIKDIISADGKPYNDRVQVMHDAMGPLLVSGTYTEIYNKIFNTGWDKQVIGFHGKKRKDNTNY